MKHQRLDILLTKTQLHENIPPLQEIVKPQAAVTTQAGVHEQPQPQQALLGEQQITNAGNEGFPTTRTRANPCDVAVEQSALTVQSTELEQQLQAREAAHQQEIVKMKQEYKVIIVVLYVQCI